MHLCGTQDMGCGNKLDHGVLLVGYGAEGKQTCNASNPAARVCSTTETCCKDAPGGGTPPPPLLQKPLYHMHTGIRILRS